jgi:hypothetical protein
MMKNNFPNKIKYPYARLKGMNDFFSFLRELEWNPQIIDKSLLKTLAIAKGKENETINALKFLGIIDQNNTTTNIFNELKSDYESTLNRIVRECYKDLFDLIPTKMINQQRLVNFFETTPETAEYQAKLFVWLCSQANIELPNMEKTIHRSRFDKKKK